MSALKAILLKQIAQTGAVDVGQFMSLALGHPEHGYYMKQDPFGRSGDFVTAPEVSQMFGEVLGAWVAHQWIQLGRPEEFVFLECGPGRGTLMADMLRATQNVNEFHAAARVCLLEMSPVLKEKQAQLLSDYDVTWCASMVGMPQNVPLIVVGNEFLDALPLRQLMYLDGAWNERVVDIVNGALGFSIRPAPKSLWPVFCDANEGDVYEFSSARMNFIEGICRRLVADKGAGLFIDYGHAKSGFGDTFQGIKGHDYVGVLDTIGDVDLTSHVDFEPLCDLAESLGCDVAEIMEQGNFLRMLGVETRAEYLQSKAAQGIDADLERLVGRDQMGKLFKVMEFRYGF